jgi:hypothetical protein
MTEPEPPPSVPEMLEQLASAYQRYIERTEPAREDGFRLQSTVDDMRWYAERIGAERWDRYSRPNKWSFEQHLWHVLKQAKRAADSGSPDPVVCLVNHGKEHVGQVAEVLGLLDLTPRFGPN